MKIIKQVRRTLLLYVIFEIPFVVIGKPIHLHYIGPLCMIFSFILGIIRQEIYNSEHDVWNHLYLSVLMRSD